MALDLDHRHEDRPLLAVALLERLPCQRLPPPHLHVPGIDVPCSAAQRAGPALVAHRLLAPPVAHKRKAALKLMKGIVPERTRHKQYRRMSVAGVRQHGAFQQDVLEVL